MRASLYIVFDRHGIDRAVKNPPVLKTNERMALLRITVPDEIFTEPPVPVIEIALTGPQIQAASVAIDGQAQPLPINATTQQKAHATALEQLAKLVEMGRKSQDPAMQAAADDALDDLLQAGVEVRITTTE
jgi:hypothetical protein